MPLSGADHVNAQLYPHQLWELGQKAYPLSLGKSSHLIGLCEGIVALVTIHKVGKVGA